MPVRKSADESGDERGQVTIGLTPSTNRSVNAWLDRHRGFKSKFIEMLVTRFTRLPDAVQEIMMGTVPRGYEQQYADDAAKFFAEAARDPLVWEEPIEIQPGSGKPASVLKPAAKRRGRE